MFEAVWDQVIFFINNIGYGYVFILMAVESSFVPFPSEIIVPPAAYAAARGELNIFLVIILGTAGSLLGAIINYFIAYYLGRAVVYKIADHRISKMLMINSKKVEKAEKFFLRYGGISTFIGRLLPAVRQLISLPAGFSKMNFKKFCFFTSLGAGFWVIVLAVLGYFFGANQELLHQHAREISYFFVALAFLIIIGIYFHRRRKKTRK